LDDGWVDMIRLLKGLNAHSYLKTLSSRRSG
jgi:hypothetical protein